MCSIWKYGKKLRIYCWHFLHIRLTCVRIALCTLSKANLNMNRNLIRILASCIEELRWSEGSATILKLLCSKSPLKEEDGVIGIAGLWLVGLLRLWRDSRIGKGMRILRRNNTVETLGFNKWSLILWLFFIWFVLWCL